MLMHYTVFLSKTVIYNMPRGVSIFSVIMYATNEYNIYASKCEYNHFILEALDVLTHVTFM